MIKSVTGYLYVDVIIVLIVGFLGYVGFFTPTRCQNKQFSGGVLVSRDFILKDRNQLKEKFDEVKEDLKDFMLEVPSLPKFPLAALFQHGSDYLSLSTRPTRVSIGFFMRKSDDRVEKFFKRDLYNVCSLPDQTNCITGEIAFKFDLPFNYA